VAKMSLPKKVFFFSVDIFFLSLLFGNLKRFMRVKLPYLRVETIGFNYIKGEIT
jgi:hypothetical protein